MPSPRDLDFWPFDLEVDVGVACDLRYPCAKFRLPRHFGFRVRADVRDIRQTSRTPDADHRIMPPRRGHNNYKKRHTRVVLHDEAWLVTYDSHRLRRYGVVYLNKTTPRHHLAAGCSTISRIPRYHRVQIGRHNTHIVPEIIKKYDDDAILYFAELRTRNVAIANMSRSASYNSSFRRIRQQK